MFAATISPAPKYFRLYESLRDQIRRGELRPDQQLPTESELCERFRLSRGTVRKAFDALTAERLIHRLQGRGSFVSPPKPSLGAFSVGEGPLGCGPTEARTLKLELVPAPVSIARKLKTRVGSRLIHIAQAQVVNNQPVIHEERWLPESLCPGLLQEDIGTASVHWLLVHKYKLPLVRVRHEIEAAQASRGVAALLDIAQGAAVFSIHRLTFTAIGTAIGKTRRVRPAVLYRAYCRADHYQFHAEFQSFI